MASAYSVVYILQLLSDCCTSSKGEAPRSTMKHIIACDLTLCTVVVSYPPLTTVGGVWSRIFTPVHISHYNIITLHIICKLHRI